MALAIAWDNLQGEERRFEPIVIMGEDPVTAIDKIHAKYSKKLTYIRSKEENENNIIDE